MIHRDSNRNMAFLDENRQSSGTFVLDKVIFYDKNVTQLRKKFDKNAKNFDKPIAFRKNKLYIRDINELNTTYGTKTQTSV